MENKTISQQLEPLFKDWRKRLEQNDDGTNFTEDGVMFQNGVKPEETEQQWLASPKRVLFLLKEQNESNNENERGGCDTRYFLTDTNWTPIAPKIRNLEVEFYKKIAYVLFGLIKTDKDNDLPFDEVDKIKEEVKELFCTQPFACVECKKISGGGKCENNVLKKHIRYYRDLLEKEIKILNPNIIVCTHDYMFNAISNMFNAKGIAPKLKVRYAEPDGDQQCGTLIMRAYHPGAYGKYDLRATYENAMSLYRAFLNWQSK